MYMYMLDTVFEVSMCNRTTVEIVYYWAPKVINVSKVVLLHVEKRIQYLCILDYSYYFVG